jgi:hypothetical protein
MGGQCYRLYPLFEFHISHVVYYNNGEFCKTSHFITFNPVLSKSILYNLALFDIQYFIIICVLDFIVDILAQYILHPLKFVSHYVQNATASTTQDIFYAEGKKSCSLLESKVF